VTPAAVQLLLGEQFGVTQTCFVSSHVSPVGQPPQSRPWPQPSPIVPQYWPPVNEQVAAVQLGAPQRLGTPEPPHVSGAVHVLPQSTGRPQPSPIVPQYVPPFTVQLVTVGAHVSSPQTPGTKAPHV
jgi:hypothetical protein